jgi:Fungal specific transcription factor domain
MLFSALHIGSQIHQANGQGVIEPLDSRMGPAFFTKAGQALLTGQYHKARPFSVEAVLLYAVCKYRQNEDPDRDAWVIMGISARLAMRMRYHRDPRHFGSPSPFEGEMRRRTFFIVQTFELLLSFQA